MLVDIDKIIIKDRIRKDFGNIEGLADSIKKNGLANAILITPDFELIAGERRYRAIHLLGHKQIEARVMNIEDEEHMLSLEIDENEERKEFSKLERLDWARKLERIERIKAEKRRVATQNNNSARADVENFPPQITEGKTRDIVADKLGIGSGKQYEKEKYIENNLHFVTDEEKQAWDNGNISDHAMYKKIKSEKETLEKKASKLEQETKQLKVELEYERNKPPQVEFKEVIKEKVIDNTDYSSVETTKRLEEKVARLENSKKIYEDAMNAYKKEVKEYQDFKDKISRMSCINGGDVDEIKALDDVNNLYLSINRFIKNELSPVKYNNCMRFINSSEHVTQSFINMINIVEEWCLDMREKLDNDNDIITVEVN